jgi:hypothetical protein
MFRSTTIIRELVLSLAKVLLEHLCPYRLCGGVQCAVYGTQHTRPSQDMLPHHHITYKNISALT